MDQRDLPIDEEDATRRDYDARGDRIADLEAKLEQMEEALRPFARAADCFDNQRQADNAFIWSRESNVPGIGNVRVSVADLRNARAALSPSDTEEEA